MRRSSPAATLLALLIVASPALCPAGEGEPLAAGAAFERLKGMAGRWECKTEGQPLPDIVYKVTAAGSAVVETMFEGSDHEMVTVYHLDGDDLLLTHYCAAGNQPRLKLDRAASTADRLVFAFDGGTNLDPAVDVHMHEGRLEFAEGGKVLGHWTGYVGGKPAGSHTFEMTRKP